MVIRQLQVERRTWKVRWSKTNVLPLYHATNSNVVMETTHYVSRPSLTVCRVVVEPCSLIHTRSPVAHYFFPILGLIIYRYFVPPCRLRVACSGALCFHIFRPVVCRSRCPSRANVGSPAGAPLCVWARPRLCQHGLTRRVGKSIIQLLLQGGAANDSGRFSGLQFVISLRPCSLCCTARSTVHVRITHHMHVSARCVRFSLIFKYIQTRHE